MPLYWAAQERHLDIVKVLLTMERRRLLMRDRVMVSKRHYIMMREEEN
jgi:hypothetical protein